MNPILNEQEQNIISENIVKNTNSPIKTVIKRLNKFLIKTHHFNDETKLLIALLVFNGLICINNNNN